MAKKPAGKAAAPEIVTDFGDKPPIIYTIDDEQYHGSSGISRSGLWTIYKHNPFKFRYGKKEETPALSLGKIAGCAILEPDELENRYMRTELERAGTNAWKDQEAEAASLGRELVKAPAYDKALLMREAVWSKQTFRKIMEGARVEQAAYVIDKDTGVLCKAKPDIFNEKLGVMCDLKTAAEISAFHFGKAIANYGYHVQESFYTECWSQVADIKAYVFAVVESDEPFDIAFYEIPPAAHREGRVIHKTTLETYAQCLATDTWPGYPDKVTPCDLPRWGYENTSPDDGED